MSNLCQTLSKYVEEAAKTQMDQTGPKNAERNRPYYEKTINDLEIKPNPTALVIGGGPSLHRDDLIPKILSSNFKGDIICADSSLGFCLKRGLVPHYVLTADPHPSRILAFFGDPQLKMRPADDFLSRRDPKNDPTARNEELIESVNEHGKNIKVVISTSVDPSVPERCLQAGMDLYWWNPIYDDYEQPDSTTRNLFERNHIPCMATGGNVGAASWVFAHSLLKRKNVGLVAIDLSYAPNTPLINTQYHEPLVEIFGDKAKEAYMDIHNPYIKETWFVDPTFLWFRNMFLEMAKEADCTTYNCTEGGVLFGEGIEFVTLSDFLYTFSESGKGG